MATRTPIIDGSIKYQYRAGVGRDFVPNRSYAILSSYATALAKGHIVTLSSGNVQLAAADSSVVGVIQDLLDINGNQFKEGYRPASVAAYCTIIPLSMVELAICEDGAGGVIDFPTNSYVSLLTQTILQTSTNNYDPGPAARTLLDSSTAASSAGSLTFQILRADDDPSNVRPQGDTTSSLRYIVIPVAAKLQTA